MCKNLWMYLKSPHGCLESELWMEPPLSPCVGTKFCYDIPDRWSVSLCLTLPTRRSSLRCESLSSIYIQSWLLEASSVHELENTFADYFIIEASFFFIYVDFSLFSIFLTSGLSFRQNSQFHSEFTLMFWFQGLSTFRSFSCKNISIQFIPPQPKIN